MGRLEEQLQGTPPNPEETEGDTERIIHDVEEFLRLEHRQDDDSEEP